MSTLVIPNFIMRAKYAQVFYWHLVFCIFYYQIRVLLLNRSWDTLNDLVDPSGLYLVAASFLVLYLFAAGTYWVLHHFYNRPWYVLNLALFISTIITVAIRYVLEEQLAPVLIGFRNYPQDTSFLDYYLDNLYFALLHGAIGAIVFLLQMTSHREQQRQELLVENQRTELAYLRSQINPHFLFNTLNNIYSLFFQQSDRALKAVERLTVMLRYGLYEQTEKVPLQKELEHLINFIELEKMRYDFEPPLQLNLPEDTSGVLIPPLLLITFVENAFKHGDLRQMLTIDLDIQDESIHYKVVNATKVQQKDKIGGIGLENLKKRLALIYGEKQKLELLSQTDTFSATLKIDLS